MDIDKLIQNRRSTFTSQFSGEKIDDAAVERLLCNANWAPTHYHTEPWRFKVYSENGLDVLLDKLAELYKQHAPPHLFSQAKFDKYQLRKKQVSHAIAIVLNKSGHPELPVIEEVCAAACAVQNLWLTVASIPKIGGYWSTGPTVYSPEFAQFLNLNDRQECLGIFFLGVTKPNAINVPGVRKDWREKVEFIK
jgi:nitroreductase